MNIPDKIGFHEWYEKLFKEEMTMTYSEIYTELCKGDNFMLNEIVKIYSKEQEDNFKQIFNSPLDEIELLKMKYENE